MKLREAYRLANGTDGLFLATLMIWGAGNFYELLRRLPPFRKALREWEEWNT